MPALAEAGPDQSWELRIKSKSLMWVAKTQQPEPSLLLPKVCMNRELESAMELELEPRHSDMGCGQAKLHLYHCTECLSPVVLEFLKPWLNFYVYILFINIPYFFFS